MNSGPAKRIGTWAGLAVSSLSLLTAIWLVATDHQSIVGRITSLEQEHTEEVQQNQEIRGELYVIQQQNVVLRTMMYQLNHAFGLPDVRPQP